MRRNYRLAAQETKGRKALSEARFYKKEGKKFCLRHWQAE